MQRGHWTWSSLTWLVALADQPIYMLYEGRRRWPKAMREKRLAALTSRLTATMTRADQPYV